MSVLSVTSEVKPHLNIAAATLTHDTELQSILDAAEAAITEKCGPLSATSITERVKGGGTGLVLRQTPVVSVTSVTPVGGSAYDADLYDVDLLAGVIEFASGAWFSLGRYDVVYSAGRSTMPRDLRLGILELVRHLWETQRGPSRRPGSTASTETSNTIPGAAYVFPFRVTQLIAPHVQVGN